MLLDTKENKSSDIQPESREQVLNQEVVHQAEQVRSAENAVVQESAAELEAKTIAEEMQIQSTQEQLQDPVSEIITPTETPETKQAQLHKLNLEHLINHASDTDWSIVNDAAMEVEDERPTETMQ